MVVHKLRGLPGWLMTRAPSWWLLTILTVLYLVPIWLFAYVPTQDGPSHVYNAHVLREYGNSDYGFANTYQINRKPFPNWLSHAMLAVLMFVFSPLMAEKVLLTLYVLGFPAAMLYFVNAVSPGRRLIPLLSFPFIYSYLLMMGFYNFALSVPLVCWALGYWWQRRTRLGIRAIILLGVLCVGVYFAHLVSCGVLVFALLLFSVICAGIRCGMLTLAATSPSILLMLNYLIGSDVTAGGFPKLRLSRAIPLLKDYARMDVLVSHHETQFLIGHAVFGLLCLLVLITLWRKLGRHPEDAQRWSRADAYLLLFGILLAAYLVLPGSIGPGGWVNDRVAILATVLILPWLHEPRGLWWRRAFAGVTGLIVLAHIVVLGASWQRLSTEVEEFTSCTQSVEQNSVVLPFFFDPSGSSLRIGIFVNAANYYCLDNGGINLGNYEVQFDYFPVNFRESFRPPVQRKEWVQTVHWGPETIDICGYIDQIDCLLIWDDPDARTAAAIDRCYALPIAHEGQLTLYPGQRRLGGGG